jgi:hypothetical protein
MEAAPADEVRKANLASLQKARAAKAELKRQLEEAKELEKQENAKRERDKEQEQEMEEESNRIKKKRRTDITPELPLFLPRTYRYEYPPTPEPEPTPPKQEPTPIPTPPPEPTIPIPPDSVRSEMWSAGIKIGTAIVLYFVSSAAAGWGAKVSGPYRGDGQRNRTPNPPPDTGLQYWQ